jgi:hypothetical protein
VCVVSTASGRRLRGGQAGDCGADVRQGYRVWDLVEARRRFLQRTPTPGAGASLSGEPDEAVDAGLQAVNVARETSSERTMLLFGDVVQDCDRGLLASAYGNSDRLFSALSDPVRNGPGDERLPLPALRVEVLRVVVNSKTVLAALDLD